MTDAERADTDRAQVEAVLFDVDETICEYERGTADLLPVAFERAGIEPFFGPPDYHERFGRFLDESEDVEDLRERCFADIARDRGLDPGVGRAVARAYAVERDHTNVRWRDGARDALERLSGEFRLAAVTNGSPEMQREKLNALGVNCFETVVFAGYDTLAKPDPEPFEVALEAVGVAPGRAVFVGDSLEADVAGARAAGLRTVWLADGESEDPVPRPDWIVDAPGEILALPWVG